MKGIICAGGLGTRLYPLTRATNKHLLPIYDKPMIYYPIQTLVKAGVKEVLIVVGGPHAGDFINVFRNGEEFGLKKVEYAYQDEDKKGISDAILYGESFANGQNVAVILGDNTTDADITKDVNNFKTGAKIFLKKVKNPERYGVPVFNTKKKIIKIEEKPKKPKSSYAVTGLYLYDNNVFECIKNLKPSKRGEFEVTDLNNIYIDRGTLDYTVLKGFWSDAGTFDSLFETNMYWSKYSKKDK
jgi:glucose-1-phosphate thymidylyltransferase